MKIVAYKGHTIKETSTTNTGRGIRNVFLIEGKFGKNACHRPFLTSITACKEYIKDAQERADAFQRSIRHISDRYIDVLSPISEDFSANQ